MNDNITKATLGPICKECLSVDTEDNFFPLEAGGFVCGTCVDRAVDAAKERDCDGD